MPGLFSWRKSMPKFSNPSEIAREALRLLAVRRLSPSPENYQALYSEIAGTAGQLSQAVPARELKALVASLPKETVGQQRLARRFEQALAGKQWDEIREGLSELVRQLGKESDLAWNELFGDLLRQWENKQAGLTIARKRESLERVLASGTANSELLFGRLQGLVKAWSQNAPGQALRLPPGDPRRRSAELRAGLLNLLQLLIDNVSELVVDDRWLNGTDRNPARHRRRPAEPAHDQRRRTPGSRKSSSSRASSSTA
jgi:hypothetical protein